MRRLGWITSASLLLGSCVMASEPTVVGPRYVHPPTIVVATRGPIEVVQPWLASLRRAKTATISAELANQPMIPELEKEQRRLVGLEKTEPSRYAKRDGEAELADICAGARTGMAPGALDEIVVIRVFVDRQHDQKCIENKYVGAGVGAVIAGAEPGARICVRWKYRGTTVTKFVMAERVIASTWRRRGVWLGRLRCRSLGRRRRCGERDCRHETRRARTELRVGRVLSGIRRRAPRWARAASALRS
jgi:hypothetical protein